MDGDETSVNSDSLLRTNDESSTNMNMDMDMNMDKDTNMDKDMNMDMDMNMDRGMNMDMDMSAESNGSFLCAKDCSSSPDDPCGDSRAQTPTCIEGEVGRKLVGCTLSVCEIACARMNTSLPMDT